MARRRHTAPSAPRITWWTTMTTTGRPSGHPGGPAVIRMTIAFIVVFLVATFPATWLLMLFLGNVGVLVSYWGTLPLGILVSALLGSATAPRYQAISTADR
jgi:hypothetical protein